MIKIMNFLLKIEKWILNKFIKDSIEYEEAWEAIRKHEEEIERLRGC